MIAAKQLATRHGRWQRRRRSGASCSSGSYFNGDSYTPARHYAADRVPRRQLVSSRRWLPEKGRCERRGARAGAGDPDRAHRPVGRLWGQMVNRGEVSQSPIMRFVGVLDEHPIHVSALGLEPVPSSPRKRASSTATNPKQPNSSKALPSEGHLDSLSQSAPEPPHPPAPKSGVAVGPME